MAHSLLGLLNHSKKKKTMMNLNKKHKRLIDEGATDVPAGALEKYKKFVLDTVRPMRDPDEDDIRRAVGEAAMRYSDPR
jgi:hypothetical protein